MTRNLIRLIYLVCIWILSGPLSAQSQGDDVFFVEADRKQIELGDTLQLTYTYRADAQGQRPDFSSLQTNFEILNFHPSSRHYQVNNQITITNQWTLIVEPKSKGKLLVPPLTFHGQSTNPIEIIVNAPSEKPASMQDIMLETIVDKSAAYVQEQIKLTYRLYYSVNIEDLSADPLELDDTIIREAPSKRFLRRVDGKQFNVIEFSYLLTPERSGTLVIPRINWEFRISKSPRRSLLDRFGNFELVRRKSKEKIVRIKPIPETYPSGAAWLPARTITIDEHWSIDTEQVDVGVPITRRISTIASGLESSQLPEILTNTSDDRLKIYAEKPQNEDNFDEFGLVARRNESAAVVASVPGQIDLPEIKIPWWNTEEDALAYITLPSKTFFANGKTGQNQSRSSDSAEIASASSSADTMVPPATGIEAQTDSSPTQQIMIVLLGLSNVITLALLVWLWRGKSIGVGTDNPNSKRTLANSDVNLEQCWKRLDDAIQTNNLIETRRTTREIGQSAFKTTSLSEIASIAQEANLARLSQTLTDLEKMLYGKDKIEADLSFLRSDLTHLVETTKTLTKSENLSPFYSSPT